MRVVDPNLQKLIAALRSEATDAKTVLTLNWLLRVFSASLTYRRSIGKFLLYNGLEDVCAGFPHKRVQANSLNII